MAQRAAYDWPTIEAVLDEGLVSHVAFAADGQPVVLPMAYGRAGRVLYLHGAAGNHLLRTLETGVEACVTVTLLDGLVLARSQFHHSMNYRSVVLFGQAHAVDDPEEVRRGLRAVVEHVVAGRADDARSPNEHELRSTRLLRFPLEEGSAKVRTGGPVEEPEDLALDVWAGVLPLAVVPGAPLRDDDDRAAVRAPLPTYLRPYRRPGWPPRR
jgi:uncharacterized protein